MSDDVETIKAALEPLIVKAEQEGKWLHCHYQNLWFSPKELRAENANGKFLRGPHNWTLRDPAERMRQLADVARVANEERARMLDRIRAESDR